MAVRREKPAAKERTDMTHKRITRRDSRRLERLVGQFRILRDCQIALTYDADNFACSAGGKMSQRYSVFTWGALGEQPEPKEYLLHEVLHCVLHELRKLGKRDTNASREVREGVVLDLCRLLVPEAHGSCDGCRLAYGYGQPGPDGPCRTCTRNPPEHVERADHYLPNAGDQARAGSPSLGTTVGRPNGGRE